MSNTGAREERSAVRRRYLYLLGDSRREAARLRRQARLWDPVAHALFDRLGVRPGWKVLEIGPGQGSLYLELRRRVKGPVDAVERSAPFAERLRRLSARDGFGPGRILRADLLDAPLPRGHYDLIFARWVFLFLPDPLRHVRLLARALAPGGLLAVEDYSRDALTLIPRPPEWGDFLAADRAFFASQGGEANVGAHMPELFRRAGLRVIDVRPTIRMGRPGSAIWNWATGYFMGIMDRLGKIPPFTPAGARSLRRRWQAAGRDRNSLLITPPVIDVVGRK